jgi:SMC interacting uncharacterized protein involved in chromosome segregation
LDLEVELQEVGEAIAKQEKLFPDLKQIGGRSSSLAKVILEKKEDGSEWFFKAPVKKKQKVPEAPK